MNEMQLLFISFYSITAIDVAGILQLFNKTFYFPYNALSGLLFKTG
jgi:hypothetical protein